MGIEGMYLFNEIYNSSRVRMYAITNTISGNTEVVIEKTIEERMPITDYKEAKRLCDSLTRSGALVGDLYDLAEIERPGTINPINLPFDFHSKTPLISKVIAIILSFNGRQFIRPDIDEVLKPLNAWPDAINPEAHVAQELKRLCEDGDIEKVCEGSGSKPAIYKATQSLATRQ